MMSDEEFHFVEDLEERENTAPMLTTDATCEEDDDLCLQG